jgi:hypothetical protein
MNGKGDAPRPIVVDLKTFRQNWEQTFGLDNASAVGENEAPTLSPISEVDDAVAQSRPEDGEDCRDL